MARVPEDERWEIVELSEDTCSEQFQKPQEDP